MNISITWHVHFKLDLYIFNYYHCWILDNLTDP